MNTHFRYYDSNMKPNERIQFDIWANDEISDYFQNEKRNIAKIEIPELYDNSEPKASNFTYLECNQKLNCMTCGHDMHNCMGHFVHNPLLKDGSTRK